MRTARRTAVAKDEPQTEAASPSTNTRTRREAAQSARSARAEGKRRSQADQTNNMLGGEQGIPHNVLKNPMKPAGGKGSGSSGRAGVFGSIRWRMRLAVVEEQGAFGRAGGGCGDRGCGRR